MTPSEKQDRNIFWVMKQIDSLSKSGGPRFRFEFHSHSNEDPTKEEQIRSFKILKTREVLEIHDFEKEMIPPFHLSGKMPEIVSIDFSILPSFKDYYASFRKTHTDLNGIILNLEKGEVVFDEKTSTIEFAGRSCKLPKYKNEHDLAKIMFFNHKINTHVSWDYIYPIMTGITLDTERKLDKKHPKKIKNTLEHLNRRIRNDLNTEDALFSWKNRGVIRNF